MTYALIPAAGRGVRFNTEPQGGNKVFATLLGRPMLRWTAEALSQHAAVDGILVVTGTQEMAQCREALAGLDKVMAIVPGGATRQESVAIGVYALGGAADDLILVHDGARPLVTQDILTRCLETAAQHGNAVAAVPVTDTLKAADAHQVVTETRERTGLWAVQTPQTFRLATLLKAHVAARDAGFAGTDEASLVEQFCREPVHLVPGAPENIKMTRPEDLRLAEAVLRARMGQTMSGVRVGFGYDIHRFALGRRLMLGGVEVVDPEGRGLEGHSDADVLLHALCDALLGAAALPDIGTLFPNTDPAYEGIAGARLLSEVARLIAEKGYQIINVDATVIAESPKIAPYVPQMRARIAEALRLNPTQVGIKATTNEGMGALGQQLGIAAHAVAGLAS